jgi:hypothetical protein
MAGEATTTGTTTSDSTTSTDKPAGAPAAGTTPEADKATDGAGSQRQVLQDLAEERKTRQKLEKDLDDLKAKHLTEHEKAVEAARKEGRDEVLSTVNARVVKAEIRAAAAGKVQDVDDVEALLGDLTRFVDSKNEVKTKEISSAIDELVKAKPYLAATATAGRPKALQGGAATASSGVSINDAIRQAAGRA